MRGNWIGAALSAALCVALSGCGAVDDLASDDEPVPTVSVQPSSSAPTTEGGMTLSAEPSASAEPSEESSTAEPSESSAAPSSSAPADPGPAEADLGRAPTSYDEAAAYVAKARDEGGAEQMRIFGTSEDVYCLMSSDYILPSCELPQGAGIQDQSVCRNAMGDRVGRIEVTEQRARPVCNTDTIRETRPQTVEPVSVVTNAKSGLRCAVADIGITCVQPQREIGFFLSLDSYATFG
ncbi:hypothetical protein KUV85_03930 [Nocardioides panacisoli]|uniref:hypothetical protein n=1 Tax=Nocardioides panacisoli TaxID=627624 RepID=UPI001C62BE92|nr:hypothetical protein [Nocardioides panacisoli]QYJ04843.1 hypothetical protein KUV85_03930 [Nocardioides panacisoli]